MLSLASDDDDEDDRQDDDDVVSEDDGLFPSMIIITLFSAGVPSLQKVYKYLFKYHSVKQPFKVSPSELFMVATLFFSVGLRGCILLKDLLIV